MSAQLFKEFKTFFLNITACGIFFSMDNLNLHKATGIGIAEPQQPS
jgi:hypothetical protein